MIKIYDLDMAIEKENEIRNKCEIEKNRIANYSKCAQWFYR